MTALAPATAEAQATLHGVGDLPGGIVSSTVRDVTKVDGVIYAVGGTSAKPGTNALDTAYLWTSTGGLAALPDLVPGLNDTNGIIGAAITPDARYIASRSRFNPGNSFQRRAVRVTTSGLTSLDLGALPGFPENSVANAISSDGSILYGFARYNSQGQTRAVRWTAGGPTITAIPFAVAGDDISNSAGRGTSSDGSVMVGTSTNSGVDGGDFYGVGNHAFRYVHGTGVATVPYLAGGTWNAAMAVSPDGNLVLVGGDSGAAPNGEVYLYNATTGATTAFGTPTTVWAIDNVSLFGGMSADGSLVVTSFSAADGRGGASVLLHNTHGWHDLQTVIDAAGADLTGWTINGIFGMSADGTLIWGQGSHNGNTEGVIVEFPAGYLSNYVSTPAISIVGSWTIGDTTKQGSTVITFLNNGYGFSVEDATGSGTGPGLDGFVRATYTWNPVTKAFVVTSELQNTIGIPDDVVGVPGTATIAGDFLTLSFPTPSGTDTETFVRVAGTSPIVGSWLLGNPAVPDSSVLLTFLANGIYFMAEDGDSSVATGDPNGHDGMERGTYTWNPVTGAFSATALADTSGEWGLSHPQGPTTVSVNGDTLTLAVDVGVFQAARVRYIPLRPEQKPNYQGVWWNASPGSEAGWGINFAHQGDTIFATWFTYGADGKPLWLIALLKKTGPGVYSGPVSTVTGSPFDSVPFDSSKVVETDVGTMTLTFAGHDSATMAYAVDGVAQTKTIVRQVFASPVPTCVWGAQPNLAVAANFQDMWWNYPAGSESGWGINFAHQGDVIFATWFTYGADGKPVWFIVVANRTAASTYAGPVSTVTGPPFNAVPFDPASVTETVVGNATLTFADGNRATFDYTVNGKSQSKQITRQVFNTPGTACY